MTKTLYSEKISYFMSPVNCFKVTFKKWVLTFDLKQHSYYGYLDLIDGFVSLQKRNQHSSIFLNAFLKLSSKNA